MAPKKKNSGECALVTSKLVMYRRNGCGCVGLVVSRAESTHMRLVHTSFIINHTEIHGLLHQS